MEFPQSENLFILVTLMSRKNIRLLTNLRESFYNIDLSSERASITELRSIITILSFKSEDSDEHYSIGESNA